MTIEPLLKFNRQTDIAILVEWKELKNKSLVRLRLSTRPKDPSGRRAKRIAASGSKGSFF